MKKESKYSLDVIDVVTIGTAEKQYIFQNMEKEEKHTKDDISIIFSETGENKEIGLHIILSAKTTPVNYVKCRWHIKLPKKTRFLGDAWERGYGELGWQGFVPERHMPWYFLANTGEEIACFGVKVRPSAMCYWQVDSQGITLYMDTRAGGEGVILSGRKLDMATIVTMTDTIVSSFETAGKFCKNMCDDPILPSFPVYGSNNWYYAYGNSSEEEILSDTEYVLDLTKGASNKPFMVIDDCWQEHHRLDEYNGGPWRCGNDKFTDMKALADKLRDKGTHPGIWVRFLQNEDATIPNEWRISHNGCLDPTHPQALQYIKEDVSRICNWGYELIKHDFSTFDLFGKWGFEMNPLVTVGGWHFYNQGLTSAEVVKMLYRAILEAAVPTNTLILGCNTIGHLGAGLMHIHRTGDDTSGKNWERTRRMGINTLAFRLPQHRTFFDVDADCVGIMGTIPWSLNRQWAQCLAESGTSLFVSAKPGILTKEEQEELHQIMLKASTQDIHYVPTDWEDTTCPEVWTDGTHTKQYNWYPDEGLLLEARQNKYHVNLPLS